jgi:ketosteroid isomerase-like protein
MLGMTPEATARAYVEAINRRDVERLCALMTEDHVFVDALGGAMRGRDAMRAAWDRYFAAFPDYWLRCAEVTSAGDVVGLFGRAGGTFREGDGRPADARRWESPAAWLAVVRDGRVAEWRVYCDTGAAFRAMGV